jgi:hypothetical protein
MQGHFPQSLLKIPVLIPDSRESDQESGSLRTASSAIFFMRSRSSDWLRLRLAKIPIKLPFLSLSAISREANGFHHLACVGKFLRVGRPERFLMICVWSSRLCQLGLTDVIAVKGTS